MDPARQKPMAQWLTAALLESFNCLPPLRCRKKNG